MQVTPAATFKKLHCQPMAVVWNPALLPITVKEDGSKAVVSFKEELRLKKLT